MRILLGILFLTVWGSNLHKGLYEPDSYAGLIRGYAADGDAPEPWKEMMGFIADHASLFARLQLVGEIALGLLLVVGLWLRIVGVLAWAFLLGLWISEIGVPGEWAWSLVFPAVVALAVAFVPEARRWSLDARRQR
ncbi:MAG: DoxX family membrane protein [Thermoleophilia bacterium]|nr:DoxX family membrane protein [Thermoleophilia bacterium]